MVYYSINDRVYSLELGSFFENQVKDYIHGGFLEFDNLDLEERYQKIDYLFGFVERAFVASFGDIQDENPDYKYASEIHEITSRVPSVDRLQKYVHQRGNIERSIELIHEFMEQILSLRDRMLNEDKEQNEEMRQVI